MCPLTAQSQRCISRKYKNVRAFSNTEADIVPIYPSLAPDFVVLSLQAHQWYLREVAEKACSCHSNAPLALNRRCKVGLGR